MHSNNFGISKIVLSTLVFSTLLFGPAMNEQVVDVVVAEHWAPLLRLLASQMQQIGDAGEVYHVCSIGSFAPDLMDSFVLQPAGAVRVGFQMQSSMSEEFCVAEEARIAGTLFTILRRMEDRCAAHWKTHSLSCDVLIHAHSGADCTELLKSSISMDLCNANLLMFFDDPALRTCIERRAALEVECFAQARWILMRTEDWVVNAVTSFTEAMDAARARHGASSSSLIGRPPGADPQSLRRRLQEAHKDDGIRLRRLTRVAPLPSHEDSKLPIVIHQGSVTVRAGFAGDANPRVVFACVVGRPKAGTNMGHALDAALYVGDEAQKRWHMLDISQPMKPGKAGQVPPNWGDMELIWNYTFHMLNANPADHPVYLIAQHPVHLYNLENPEPSTPNPVVSSMFSTFGVNYFYVSSTAVSAIWKMASRKSAKRSDAPVELTGLVVDAAAAETLLVPVYQNMPMTSRIQRFNITGEVIDEHLRTLLLKAKYNFEARDPIVRDIKEKLCYVAFDYNKELDLIRHDPSTNGSYLLPDGHTLVLREERIKCGEALFQPSLVENLASGRHELGVHAAIRMTLEAMDVAMRSPMLGNVVVSGGNTLLPGFCERLEKELKASWPKYKNDIHVFSQDSLFTSWAGASLVQVPYLLDDHWMTQDEYLRHGSSYLADKYKRAIGT